MQEASTLRPSTGRGELPDRRLRTAWRHLARLGACLAFVALSAHAQRDVELEWNASSSGDPVRYTVYYGTSSRTYNGAVPFGNVTTGVVPGLLEGRTYYFAVTASDALGAESPYSDELVHALTGDGGEVIGSPADISLFSPAAGSSYTAPAVIPLAASVDAGEKTVARVQFFNGSTLIAEVIVEPFEFNWTAVGPGTYALTAVATLDDESTLSTAEVTVTVTAEPSGIEPSITLTSPTVGASFLAPASIGLGATVTANGNNISRVRFYNGTTLLSEDYTAPFSFTWIGVPGGSYNLSAQVVYGAGETVSTPVRTISVGGGVPTVSFSSPAAGASYAAPASIPLAANVNANGSTISRVRFFNGSTLLAEDTSSPYSYTWSAVPAGTHSISAQVVYGAGSTVSTPVRTVAVTSQTATPTITLTSPTIGASYTAPASVSLTASVNANGNTLSRVRFYNGSTLLTEDYTAPFSYTWSPVQAGTYNVSAQLVYGSAKTVSTPARTISVNAVLPTIVLSSPAAGMSYVAPATFPLTASVTANGNTLSRVRFFNGTTLLSEDYTVPFVFTWTPVAAGTYNLSAQLVYGSGKTLTSATTVVQVNALPAPWRAQDLGSLTTLPGATTSYASGTFTVAGAGNLSGSADNFRFLYQPLTGDGQIVARLSSLQNTSSGARIGVMIRESLTAGSRHVFLGLSPDGLVRRLIRSTTGGSTTGASVTSGSTTRTPPNVWLRIVRSGNTFTASSSTNGTTWVQEGTSSVTMASNIQMGIAVASGTSSTVNRSTFSNVTATP